MLQNAKLELRKSKRKDYYKVLGIDKNANEEEVRISCCGASLQVTYLSGTIQVTLCSYVKCIVYTFRGLAWP